MIARIFGARQRRRAAKAKARRIGLALRDFAQLDLEFRGRAPHLDRDGKDQLGIQHQTEASR